MQLWSYFERGGKRAVAICHRRWGKDEVSLHMTAVQAHKRIGGYWHMLPEASQARKAIWDAINPATGKRRIDEAFPHELRKSTRETDMYIQFKCGSSWQVVGSDNFSSLVGSPPIGLVFSEWAISDPRAWAYLRPILDQNGGWAAFITTPRGRNHAFRSLETAKAEKGWLPLLLPATKTPVFTAQQLEDIKREMIGEMGQDDGTALFEQEYLCSFDAPLVGSFYASLLADAERSGRFVTEGIRPDPTVPVQTAWDLGYSDDTVIWFFQVVGREIRILDFYQMNGEDIAHYCNVIKRKAITRGWSYADTPLKALHWVPWDAAPKSLQSGGRSLMEMAWKDHGIRMRLVPNLSVQDGIQAVRAILPRCYFDMQQVSLGVEALRNYRREWDPEAKMFKTKPVHDINSHPADAFRMLAVAYHQPQEKPAPVAPPPIRGMEALTLNKLFADYERDIAKGSWRV